MPSSRLAWSPSDCSSISFRIARITQQSGDASEQRCSKRCHGRALVRRISRCAAPADCAACRPGCGRKVRFRPKPAVIAVAVIVPSAQKGHMG
jgi:hypothetical protein